MDEYEKELSVFIVNQIYKLLDRLCSYNCDIPQYRITCLFQNNVKINKYEFENFQYKDFDDNIKTIRNDECGGWLIIDEKPYKYEYLSFIWVSNYYFLVMFSTNHILYETIFFSYVLATYFKNKKSIIEDLLKSADKHKNSRPFTDHRNRSIFRELSCGYETESIISQAVIDFFYKCYGIDINLITTLSCEVYEGTSNVCSIYIPRKYVGRGKRDNELPIKLSEKVEFSFREIRRIRKYMEIATRNINMVLDINKMIIGYTNKSNKKYEGKIKLDGKLNWTFYLGSKLLIYNAGVYRIISDTISEKSYDYYNLPLNVSQRQIERILNIIREAKRQSHGTTIVFGETEQIKSETTRLAYYNRCIQISPINLVRNIDFLLNLTSIDGAVLVDFNGKCYAIGAILDGDMAVKGNMERGARFNSTVNYIERQKEKGQDFLAAIISEDSTIDIYPSARVECAK